MMKARVKRILLFFINIFLLANFIVGTLLYIFTPERKSPVPEPKVIVMIGLVSAVFTLTNVFYEP